MPGIKDLVNVWTNLKEVDLRPYQKEALRAVKLAIVGRPGVGRHTLANQLMRDPRRPQEVLQSGILVSDLVEGDWASTADLIILVVDAAAADYSQERALAKKWTGAGKKCLAFINQKDQPDREPVSPVSLGWEIERVVRGSASDLDFLRREFVPPVLDLLEDRHLALGRQFPLFRVAIATKLINDTCFANAVYSLSTGVAEVVPIFDLPLNLADMIVLTKAQAFLVYKLGLSLGFSTRWEDYLAEFGSVVGGGFVWRQLSRMLIGLIPVWGIVPKVAVAYSGTYVVGHVVLQWYLTGRRLSGRQMRALYNQAFANGKNLARDLASRMPRPRLGRQKPARLPEPQPKVCSSCGKLNAPDALFCQYCGLPFTDAAPEKET